MACANEFKFGHVGGMQLELVNCYYRTWGLFLVNSLSATFSLISKGFSNAHCKVGPVKQSNGG